MPGETKVWQYITLTKRIFLIDCPGVVSNRAGDTDTDAELKGVSRVENLDDATEHVAAILTRVKPAYLVCRFLGALTAKLTIGLQLLGAMLVGLSCNHRSSGILFLHSSHSQPHT